MNSIKEINRINQRELELGLSGKGSWHDEYKDSAYVFVGGLAYELTEGDVITILSQWGEVVDINMPRDKATGKAKGFAFVMYEDQRSTVLAVDNMNGIQVLGRTLRVDHCRKYNQPGEKNKEGEHVAPEEPTYNAMPPTLDGSDDSDSDDTDAEGDDLDEEDPMAAYLRAEKKKEKAKAKGITGGDGKKKRKHEHDGETKEERRARKEAKRAKKAEKEARKLGKRDRDESRHKTEEEIRRREVSGSASASRDRYADERRIGRGDDKLERTGSDRDRRGDRDRSPVARGSHWNDGERNGRSREEGRPRDRYDRDDRYGSARHGRGGPDGPADIARDDGRERASRDARLDRGAPRDADRERSYRDERSDRGPSRDVGRERSYRDERIDRDDTRGVREPDYRRESGDGGRSDGPPRRDEADRYADRR